MKELGFDEYRNLIFELLLEVDQYCKSSGLTYFLDSGTLLGAVRHQGFIPWDDDIDIIMPREDYNKFIKHFDSDRCYVLTNHNDKDYYYQYAKVVLINTILIEKVVPPIEKLGVNIDVFPIDGLPNNKLLRRFHQDKLFVLSKCRTIVVRTAKVFGTRKTMKSLWCLINTLIENNGIKYSMYKTNYCGNIVATTVRHKETRSQCFSSVCLLVFENIQFPAPIGYNEYLTDLFGDYMQLPPVELRVPKHDFKAYKK